MNIKQRRQHRGWSQEQLAEISGLSVRTIQRIENGESPSAETLKSLAAVFEVSLSELQQIADESKSEVLSAEERSVLREVRCVKEFYRHFAIYVAVIALLFFINLITSTRYIWAVWPMLGWGIGVAAHGMAVFKPFKFLGNDWERREFEKRLAARKGKT